MQPVIVEASASGGEVGAIIANRLIPAVADIERPKVMLSLLAFYIVLAKPDATAEEVKTGVLGASEWLTMHLSAIDIEAVDLGMQPN